MVPGGIKSDTRVGGGQSRGSSFTEEYIENIFIKDFSLKKKLLFRKAKFLWKHSRVVLIQRCSNHDPQEGWGNYWEVFF